MKRRYVARRFMARVLTVAMAASLVLQGTSVPVFAAGDVDPESQGGGVIEEVLVEEVSETTPEETPAESPADTTGEDVPVPPSTPETTEEPAPVEESTEEVTVEEETETVTEGALGESVVTDGKIHKNTTIELQLGDGARVAIPAPTPTAGISFSTINQSSYRITITGESVTPSALATAIVAYTTADDFYKNDSAKWMFHENTSYVAEDDASFGSMLDAYLKREDPFTSISDGVAIAVSYTPAADSDFTFGVESGSMISSIPLDGTSASVTGIVSSETAVLPTNPTLKWTRTGTGTANIAVDTADSATTTFSTTDNAKNGSSDQVTLGLYNGDTVVASSNYTINITKPEVATGTVITVTLGNGAKLKKDFVDGLVNGETAIGKLGIRVSNNNKTVTLTANAEGTTSGGVSITDPILQEQVIGELKNIIETEDYYKTDAASRKWTVAGTEGAVGDEAVEDDPATTEIDESKPGIEKAFRTMMKGTNKTIAVTYTYAKQEDFTFGYLDTENSSYSKTVPARSSGIEFTGSVTAKDVAMPAELDLRWSYTHSGEKYATFEVDLENQAKITILPGDLEDVTETLRLGLYDGSALVAYQDYPIHISEAAQVQVKLDFSGVQIKYRGALSPNSSYVIKNSGNVDFGNIDAASLQNQYAADQVTPLTTKWEFVGWYTDPNFSEGTEYTSESEAIATNGVTLYAKWQTDVTYKSYVRNSDIVREDLVKGSKLTEPTKDELDAKHIPFQTGGWQLDKTTGSAWTRTAPASKGSIRWNFESDVVDEPGLTLYPVMYTTVTLDANVSTFGGTHELQNKTEFEAKSSQEVYYNEKLDSSKIEEPKAAEEDKLRLTGWARDAQGAQPFDLETAITETWTAVGNTTLYAQWESTTEPEISFAGKDPTDKLDRIFMVRGAEKEVNVSVTDEAGDPHQSGTVTFAVVNQTAQNVATATAVGNDPKKINVEGTAEGRADLEVTYTYTAGTQEKTVKKRLPITIAVPKIEDMSFTPPKELDVSKPAQIEIDDEIKLSVANVLPGYQGDATEEIAVTLEGYTGDSETAVANQKLVSLTGAGTFAGFKGLENGTTQGLAAVAKIGEKEVWRQEFDIQVRTPANDVKITAADTEPIVLFSTSTADTEAENTGNGKKFYTGLSAEQKNTSKTNQKSDDEIRWSSSDESIATVEVVTVTETDGEGNETEKKVVKVTALTAGDVTIHAYAVDDEGHTRVSGGEAVADDFTITVKAKANVSFSDTEIETIDLTDPENIELGRKVVYTPEYATEKGMTWAITDPADATGIASIIDPVKGIFKAEGLKDQKETTVTVTGTLPAENSVTGEKIEITRTIKIMQSHADSVEIMDKDGKAIEGKALALNKGDSMLLSVDAAPETQKDYFYFTSSDANVATVVPLGNQWKLTAVGNGEAKIKVTAFEGSIKKGDEVSDEITVTVVTPIKGVSLSPAKVVIKTGDKESKAELTAKILPEGASVPTEGVSYDWEHSPTGEKAIFEWDVINGATATIKGVDGGTQGGKGTVTVTLKIDGNTVGTATTNVEVVNDKNPVDSMTLDPATAEVASTPLTLTKGDIDKSITVSLKGTDAEKDVTYDAITVESSNSSVATARIVEETVEGKKIKKLAVTAQGEGDAEITLTSVDTPSVTKKVYVKVGLPVANSIKVDDVQVTVGVGGLLEVKTVPNGAKLTDIKWAIDAKYSEYAKIDGSDNQLSVSVEALKAGKAQIKVTAKNSKGDELSASAVITVVASDVMAGDDPWSDDVVVLTDNGTHANTDVVMVGFEKEKTFNGKKITQEVRLYERRGREDGEDRLMTKKEYSISYKNNLNAGENTAEMIITLKGNYNIKKKVVKFTIKPADITKVDNDAARAKWEASLDRVVASTNEKELKTTPKLKFNGYSLKNTSKHHDYKLVYYNEADEVITAPVSAGKYTLEVIGQGNFREDTKLVYPFTIGDKDKLTNVATWKVGKLKDLQYTGSEFQDDDVKALVDAAKVKNGKNELAAAAYEVVIPDGIKEVGSYTATITAVNPDLDGDGEDDVFGQKKVTFNVVGAKKLGKTTLDTGKVWPSGKSAKTYTGEEVYPGTSATEGITIGFAYKKGVTALQENADVLYKDAFTTGVTVVTTKPGDTDNVFYVTYTNNVNKGTAKAVYTGYGFYKGVNFTKTYKINPLDISTVYKPAAGAVDKEITLDISDAPMAAGGAKPQVEVMFDGEILTLGTDYTLSYKNNKKYSEGAKGSVTIKGKGNFKGTIKDEAFDIVERDLDEVELVLTDKAAVTKGTGWKSKVKVLTPDGKALKEKKDYTVTYSFDGDGQIPGEGTIVTVRVDAVEGSGYTGFAEGTYKIFNKKMNLAKAKIVFKSQPYTNIPVTVININDEETLYNMIDWSKSDTSFQTKLDQIEVIKVVNGHKAGTCKVTLKATDDSEWGGTKTVNLKITKATKEASVVQ